MTSALIHFLEQGVCPSTNLPAASTPELKSQCKLSIDLGSLKGLFACEKNRSNEMVGYISSDGGSFIALCFDHSSLTMLSTLSPFSSGDLE